MIVKSISKLRHIYSLKCSKAIQTFHHTRWNGGVWSGAWIHLYFTLVGMAECGVERGSISTALCECNATFFEE